MSDHNGNGDRLTPLEAVEQRIATRLRLETIPGPLREEGPTSTAEEEPSPITEDDPLIAWKRRTPGKPVTLEQLHAGLIATCEYSEAAIEGGLKMASDVHEVVQTVDQRTRQIAILTAKAESTSAFVHKIDEEMAASNRLLAEVRRDVQFLKDDMREVKALSQQAALQLPVVKDMLGEILARLPDPGSEKKPAV